MRAFPNVTLPGIEIDPEGKELLDRLNAQHQAWRGLKVGMAIALLKRGAKPYVRPSGAEVAKRRARGKRQRLARKAHR